nr:hypothetical protein [Acidimicrobiia bacterium]
MTDDLLTASVSEANYTAHDPMEWYEGTIVAVQPDEGTYGPQYKISIDTGVVDQDGNARYTFLWVPRDFTAGNKGGKLLNALFGATYFAQAKAAGSVSLTSLVGLPVHVMFEHYTADQDSVQVKRERVLNTNAGLGIRS